MKPLLGLIISLGAAATVSAQGDYRLEKPKDYNGYFPWTPPRSLEEWRTRREVVRRQLLVANGLWPMWERAPLKPTIHGKIDREGYTVEKVYFASLPGHYVTGSLYRPTGAKGKSPGVLCPHGHWANGRFFTASDKAVAAEIKSGAEKTEEGARHPLQARCAQLARMGCVVFHYDMVGNADSTAIKHRDGFTDVEAELRLQNFMGLQTFNSIRALDFLMSLPDVDTSRIGVTGASGGGTQTFILCAIDDRPTVAFPAVMVSTAMQGGCICENASYLRIGTGNIEFAAMMAPRPLAMSAANDWTKDIDTKGGPELRAFYKLHGKEDLFDVRCWKEFGHNYNQVAREMMYAFFARHLNLGFDGPVAERPFKPLTTKELTVFGGDHPRPADEVGAERLRATLTAMNERILDTYFPADAAKLSEMQKMLGGALRAMITDTLPARRDIEVAAREEIKAPFALKEASGHRLTLARQGGEKVRVLEIRPKAPAYDMVVWVHPAGLESVFKEGALVPEAKRILDKGAGILAVEVLRTGATSAAEKFPVNKGFAGYTFGYNRPLIAERVRDIHTAIAYALGNSEVKKLHLYGQDAAGPWVALARGLAGDRIGRTAADLHRFHFGSITSMDHENMLPGALKYGGLLTLASLAAPHDLLLYNAEGCGPTRWLQAAYDAARGRLRIESGPVKDAVAWLLQ